MEERLVKRGTETEQSLKTRIANATNEIEQLLAWKKKVNYRIFNDDLETSKNTILTLTKALYPKELNCIEVIPLVQSKACVKCSLGIALGLITLALSVEYFIFKRKQ